MPSEALTDRERQIVEHLERAQGLGVTLKEYAEAYELDVRDLYNGKVDVIVADGFVGNVALKTSEGVANLVRYVLKESLRATITRQVGYLLSRSAFADFKKRLDYSEYGGAPLLGVKGACIITHGSSNANAIKNAIRVAGEFARRDINAAIEKELAVIPVRTAVSVTL